MFVWYPPWSPSLCFQTQSSLSPFLPPSLSLSLSISDSSHHSDKKLRLNSIRSLTFLTTGARLAAIGLLCDTSYSSCIHPFFLLSRLPLWVKKSYWTVLIASNPDSLFSSPFCFSATLLWLLQVSHLCVISVCSCRGCVLSRWGCNWCVHQHLCTHKPTCEEGVIIYNQHVSHSNRCPV